jgi:sigma-B regulation protein RsbU (phosphoserine phosphatase)
MSVTQTLIRGIAQYEIVPDKILAHVNDKLSDDNESLMFVTAFSATLDYVSGEMMFSNAGHNPPLIVRADGTVEWLKLPDGLVLGVMPNTPYSTMTAKLNPGDVLFTYTDGVTEAMSEHRELFSEERLYDALTECADLDPKGMADFVLQRVREHVATAPQSDDITILAIAYHGAQGEADK